MEGMEGMEEVGDAGTIEGTGSLTEDTQTVDQGTDATDSQATEQVDKQVDGTALEQEFDWTTDERYQKMWGEDPNNMYKSIINGDKLIDELKPIREQYQGLTSKFEENGINIDNLDDYIKEYNELKDPNNPRNQDMAILEEFMQNPEYEQKIGNFFRELHVENLQRQFPGMNEQQIQEQVQMREEITQLKKAEQQRMRESKEKEFLNLIHKNIDKMAKFGKDRGFEVTDNIKNEILEHCTKNNLPANTIFATFLELYGEKVFSAQENKMRDNYTRNLGKIDKTKVPSGTKKGTPKRGTSTADNKTRLRGYLEKLI